MELSNLVTWALGLVVVVLSGVWARTAAAISRNGREVAELRGRVDAIEGGQGDVKEDLANARRRIGGIGRTTDHSAGVLKQVCGSLSVILERLVVRASDGGGAGARE